VQQVRRQARGCQAELASGVGSDRLARQSGMGKVMARWRVEQFRGHKVERVGEVEADNEREAITKAIAEYRINSVLRFKLTATRIEKRGT
jgi:hypothetical protein